MSDDSGTSDVEQADIECFAALPHDTVQAIGLTANAVRKTIRDNQDTTDVVKYIRFTNVPPAVADKFSLRNTRQMFNRSTRYMIIKLLTGAHETAAHGLGGAIQHEIYNMGLEEAICPLGSKTVHGVFCRKEADARGVWPRARCSRSQSPVANRCGGSGGVGIISKAAGGCGLVAAKLKGGCKAGSYRVRQ
ncbi:hypothetical protein N7461_003303 [Penicillium sp. DV-2018c]|nr:hypothetical protein N7461_003303 [Penicillium sp. DV-2018c]